MWAIAVHVSFSSAIQVLGRKTLIGSHTAARAAVWRNPGAMFCQSFCKFRNIAGRYASADSKWHPMFPFSTFLCLEGMVFCFICLVSDACLSPNLIGV